MEILLAFGFLGILVAIIWVHRQTSDRMSLIDQRLIETRTLQGQTTESFGRIQSSLGRLTEASRHMEALGREISGLSDILRAPKLRGGIGELLLGDLLSQILPTDHYRLQHRFKSGERVDAVIMLKAGMVPVDAKFPLESFERLIGASDESEKRRFRREFSRAVKVHIDDIASKYIRPDEGTFDFALMYIPAENVYYETIIREEQTGGDKGLLESALERHVIPVSPNSFYAYLQAVALGLKGLQIEKQAQDIVRYLATIESDFQRFKSEYDTLGRHIDHAKSKYEESSRSLDRFEEKLVSAGDPSRLLHQSETEPLPSGQGQESGE
jgi:DNA recombination protein RmuC